MALRDWTFGVALFFTIACGDHAARLDATGSRATMTLVAVAPLGDTATDVGVAPGATTRLFVVPTTGPYPVGAHSMYVSDPSRLEPDTGSPRALPVRVFYPAYRDRYDEPARYLTPVVQAATEQAIGVPPGTLTVEIPVYESAKRRAAFRGVVLASGGNLTPASFQTGLVTELASQGWVVVTVDHPHDTFVTERPDGPPILAAGSSGEPNADIGSDTRTGQTEDRVRDLGIVLSHLDAVVPGVTPNTPVGMFGASLHGANAARAMQAHPRLVAAADVEGYGDFALFIPVARTFDPSLGESLAALIGVDAGAVAQGWDVIKEQREFLTRFMTSYVGGAP